MRKKATKSVRRGPRLKSPVNRGSRGLARKRPARRKTTKLSDLDTHGAVIGVAMQVQRLGDELKAAIAGLAVLIAPAKTSLADALDSAAAFRDSAEAHFGRDDQ